MMGKISLLVLVSFVGLALGDTPANCMYEDIRGTWEFRETARDGDNTLACDTMGDVVYTTTFTLDYPNIVKDELGHEGTWTLVWNQGFEVNINDRSYFAFSYYEGDFVSSTSYCDRTFPGWSRDTTIRNWSCYVANKTTTVPPRKSNKMTVSNERLQQHYQDDHKMIDRINAKQSSWRAKAYPEHEKYTLQETLNRFGGVGSIMTNAPKSAPATPEQKARADFLPANFDWRDLEGENYVSDVRDQGGCGSCYAFASAAHLEARLRMVTRNTRQDIFSTQDVVSCSVLAQGCAGGFSFLIAGRYGEDQGFVAETCNTYTGQDDPCATDSACSRTYSSSYEYLGGYYGACNEQLMLEALVSNGPMAIAYQVYSDFYNYDGGIYHHTGEKNEFNPFEMVNHAVLLVGYGVDETTGEKFWTVKNSWGDAWGENGFFRIRRGTNECSIESMAVEASVIA